MTRLRPEVACELASRTDVYLPRQLVHSRFIIFNLPLSSQRNMNWTCHLISVFVAVTSSRTHLHFLTDRTEKPIETREFLALDFLHPLSSFLDSMIDPPCLVIRI